jgi:cytochrome c
MKKVFAVLFICAVISACGGSSKSGGSADSSKAADQTAKAQQPNVDTSANKTGASADAVHATKKT